MLTADQIREELIRQLDAKTVKAADVARLLEIAAPRVTEMRKRKRQVQQNEMLPLAEYLRMDSMGPRLDAVRGVLPVPVKGKVAVGVWVENIAGNGPDAFIDFDVLDKGQATPDLFAMIAEGDAMIDEFPSGTTLICRPVSDEDGRLADGAFVIVQRTRGDLSEFSCKQVRRHDGGNITLHNCTRDPRFAEPLALDEGVAVVARVIRAYRNYDPA